MSSHIEDGSDVWLAVLTGCSRPVKSSQSLTSPVFREGVLKVFRSTLTNDLRFHCKVDRESETYWSMLPQPHTHARGKALLTTWCPVKSSNAQLVPAYAFDQRLSNVVYIRDTESDKGTGYSQGNSRLSGIYQFSSLRGTYSTAHPSNQQPKPNRPQRR